MAMTNDLIPQLKALHLYGMAAALEELLAERPRTTTDPLAWIRRLIEAEQVERQVRSLRYQLRVARFPIHRELDHLRLGHLTGRPGFPGLPCLARQGVRSETVR
jgi:hypothetical protein